MRITLALLTLLIFGISAEAQSLDHILKKNFEAHNQEIWKMLRTFSADMEWHSDLGTFYGEVAAKKPTLVYLQSEKSRFIEAFDGQQAWTQAYWTNGEITQMSPTRSLMIQELITFGSPLSEGEDYEVKGKVEVDNTPCHWLVFEENGRTTEYFIETKTHRLYKTIISQPVYGETITISRTVKKYREFNGIPVATVIELRSEELTSEYVFDGIVLGEGISSSKFKKPNG